LKGHIGDVNHIALVTSEQLISAGTDRTVRLWDLKKKSLIATFRSMVQPMSELVPVDEDSFMTWAAYNKKADFILHWKLTNKSMGVHVVRVFFVLHQILLPLCFFFFCLSFVLCFLIFLYFLLFFSIIFDSFHSFLFFSILFLLHSILFFSGLFCTPLFISLLLNPVCFLMWTVS